MSAFIPPIPSDIAVRLNYHDGMFLTAQNMTLEQNYFSNWIKLQNQCLYTPGVLNGFDVVLQNNTLVVAPGVGFDSSGDFLVFPGISGNMVPAASNLGDSYGLYAVYPPTPNVSTDTLDQAAVLQSASLTYPPSDSIILATVTMDSANPGIIKSIADSRIPVTSRLPAVLGKLAVIQSSLKQGLDGARHGSVTFDTRTLLKVGDRVSQQVFYLAGQGPAFNVPPSVNATVTGSFPYAISVSNVGTSQFTLELVAIETRATSEPSAQVNWLALSNSSTLENA
ncbi:hypothetical protein CFter6_2515 [Collimonas fungivorans]|jgi:hypothetical protein|uniref:Uncharacterized protein n=1 Tax=Collimonas fungivorans TaxID=158899 RepID=A0A127PBS9_9BURK|nr:hypothetical protein [Collimonas fungivorans]AMO95187.1 hypothetical protein CFter6_2515 [Collimonas fungivorans]